MSKGEIMTHSRAFLHGIYRMYVKRACENLGVSPDREEDSDIDIDNQVSQYGLSESDYPASFSKLPPRERKQPVVNNDPNKTREFLASFGSSAEMFKNVQIATDE